MSVTEPMVTLPQSGVDYWRTAAEQAEAVCEWLPRGMVDGVHTLAHDLQEYPGLRYSIQECQAEELARQGSDPTTNSPCDDADSDNASCPLFNLTLSLNHVETLSLSFSFSLALSLSLFLSHSL